MSSEDRYAVFTSDLSPEVRARVGDDRPHFLVWDRCLKRSVPFGGHGSVDGAQRMAYRMNHPAGWNTGELVLCLRCAEENVPARERDSRVHWRPVTGVIPGQECDWCEAFLDRDEEDTRVKSCGETAGHDPHAHGASRLRCPGSGPFRDAELAEREPDTYPGPPCVCSDSVRSVLGYCPPAGHREYGHCPVLKGVLSRGGGAERAGSAD